MPYFSIVIPTYNRASLIGETIKSTLNQRFGDFELLVIDDGSSDNTKEVVEAFSYDKRVTYFRKHNEERGAARNFGVSKASGIYINFFDSDDLMYPNHLDVSKNFIETKNNPEIFHLAYDYKTPEGDLIYCRNAFDDNARKLLLFDNILSCNGVFVRRDIAERNPFEENRVMASAEDWELWIKISSRYQIHFCNEVTSVIVAHDARSIRTINVSRVIERDLFLINKLRADSAVIKHYDGTFNKFVAERFTFIMLSLSEQKKRISVFKWGVKAAFKHFPIIWSKRFLASIKNTMYI